MDLRTAYIYVKNTFAGLLKETEDGYSFSYDEDHTSGAAR